ncbi:hypothetical protein SAMN04489747_2246 [Auraticoccus monumenti]|uniref:DUF559 domain-containing protein n=1 Tax=Auraticoccus monumenti TaxID=675864 RepID=A0A1G6ZE96_9ACTN|nr:hypothetical protein SAMN04489747_2246 [Auraticoccus monumenti]
MRASADVELDDVDRLRAFALTMSPEAFFTGASAARLYRLWLPRRLERDPSIHVAWLTGGGGRRRGRDVVGSQVAPGVVRVIRHLDVRVVTPADAWAELAGVLTVPELVVLGDQLVRRERPLATPDQLAAALARRPLRRGSQRLRLALDQVVPGTDSVKETELRLLLIGAGFPMPTVNHVLLDREGEFLARLDLAWEEYRVGAEYDGGQHRTDDVQFRRDIDRLDRVADHHWRVLRAGQHHLSAPADFLDRLDRALRERGWPGPATHRTRRPAPRT